MVLSKLAVLAGTVSAGIGDGRFPYLRALVDHQICKSNFGGLKVENGKVNCNGSVCALSGCDDGYYKLKTAAGQSKLSKCVSVKSGLKWNKDLLKCATCADFSPLAWNPDFDVQCKYVKKGGFKLKKCNFKCKNGDLIMPLGKKIHTNVMCKCKATEKDDQCHWRKGKDTYDIGDDIDFSKWSCGESKVENDEKKDQTDYTPFRIPQLKCSGTPHQKATGGGNRIVGGLEVVKNSWPWLTRLEVKTDGQTFLCGGTIIDNKTVLTAGHCCNGAESIKAYTGEHSYFEKDTTEKKHVVSEWHVHTAYDPATLQNDVCVLKFNSRRGLQLSTNQYADFACLNKKNNEIPAGTKCWAAGWGTMASGGGVADVLQEVDLDIISDEVCANTQNKDYLIKDAMMCAGYLDGGKDACQGDSGGPLICAIDDEPVLVGITSWGMGCADKNSPGVWAELSNPKIHDFIMDHVDKSM